MKFFTSTIVLATLAIITITQIDLQQSKPYQPRKFRRHYSESNDIDIRRSNRGSSVMADREYLINIMNNRFMDRRQKMRMLELISLRRGRLQNFRKKQLQRSELKKKKKRQFEQVTIGEHSCPSNVATKINQLQAQIRKAEREYEFVKVQVLEGKVETMLEMGCTEYL